VLPNLRGLVEFEEVVDLGRLVAGARDAWAWGATSHEWVSGIAIEKLPDSVPGFVRTPEAAAEIAIMGRELDRSKGAGRTHDAECDPGHYIEADDGEGDGRPVAQGFAEHTRGLRHGPAQERIHPAKLAICPIPSSMAGSRFGKTSLIGAP
jgi:hypothetical protein